MAAGAGWAELHDGRGELARLFADLWALGKPTIAKVRGWCLAGGFGLALACDLVVAADDARFGTPEVDRGLWPYMITVPMMRSMPPKVALELQLTGRRVDAAEAERIGFVNRVVPAGELDAAVAELAAGAGGEVERRRAPRPRRVLRGVGPAAPRPPSSCCTRCSPCTRSSRTPPRASPPSPRSASRRGRTAERASGSGRVERVPGGRGRAKVARRRPPRRWRGGASSARRHRSSTSASGRRPASPTSGRRRPRAARQLLGEGSDVDPTAAAAASGTAPTSRSGAT